MRRCANVGVPLIVVAFGVAACGGEVDLVPDGSRFEAATDSDAAREAVQSALTLNGMSVTWQLVGTPFAASKIAACAAGIVYALNNDATLYKGDGTDANWVYQGNPWAARDIACREASGAWIWALNSDRKLFDNRSSGNDANWVFQTTASSAVQIGNGRVLSALYSDGTVALYDSPSKSWTAMETFSGATEASAARIGLSGVGSTDRYRWFVVKDGDVYFTNGSSSALTALPIRTLSRPPGGTKLAVRDVSAARSDEVWALTENRRLYRATFVEVDCTDGQDNDIDAVPDGYDSDCFEPLGRSLCARFGRSGNFCLSRADVRSNTIAQCSGLALVGTRTGNWCTEVGDGGSDMLGVIH